MCKSKIISMKMVKNKKMLFKNIFPIIINIVIQVKRHWVNKIKVDGKYHI